MPIVSQTKKIAKNLYHLLQKPALTYLPGSWDSVRNRQQGWLAPTIVQSELSRWDEYVKLVKGKGPLGFSHEAESLHDQRVPYFHNLHITFAYALARASRHRDQLSVLDWGGSLGHYFLVAQALLPEVKIEYHCKELPSLVEAGKKVNPEVIWHADESCLNRQYDLVFINSSLQYDEFWQQTLAKLTKATGQFMLLNRIPVVQSVPTFLALQDAGGTEMFHLQINEGELLNVAKQSGLDLVREVVAGDRPRIRNAPEQCESKGWLFSKRK